MCYLKVQAILEEEQEWYFSSHSWGVDEKFHGFPMSICPQVNENARLEFELAYFVVHFWNYDRGTFLN